MVPSALADYQKIDWSTLTSTEKASIESQIAADAEAQTTTILKKGFIRAGIGGGMDVGFAGLTTNAFGGLALGVPAGIIAYKVSRATLGNYIYRLWTYDANSPVGSGQIDATAITWVPNSNFGSCPFAFPCGVYGYHDITYGYDNVWVDSPGTCGGAECTAAARAWGASLNAIIVNYGTCCGGGTVHRAWVNSNVADRIGEWRPATSGEYAAAANKADLGSTVLPNTCDATCAQNALARINANADQCTTPQLSNPDNTCQDATDQATVVKLRTDAGLNNGNVPDCAGLTVSACQTAYAAADFTGTVINDGAVDFAGADVTKPAGSIVTQDHAAGSSIDFSSDLHVNVNPDEDNMPFQYFRPLQGETYDAYVARLQAAGWLGTATYIDLTETTGDPDLGPNGVPQVGVRVYPATTPTIEITKSWPYPNPLGLASAPIVVYRNPGTFPPVPPEDPPTDPNANNPFPTVPGAITGGDCGPTVPGIDFSPLTGIDYGDKFPFGIFSYISTVLAPLVADPTAPVFDVPIYVMGNSYSIHVDLSPADPYMAVIRLLATIGIGIAAVYMLASSLLGFNAGKAGGGLEMDTELGD